MFDKGVLETLFLIPFGTQLCSFVAHVLESILNAKISCVSSNALIKVFGFILIAFRISPVLDLCEPWKQG
jgi:hypothetical protein